MAEVRFSSGSTPGETRTRTADRVDSGRGGPVRQPAHPEPHFSPPAAWQRRVFPLVEMPQVACTFAGLCYHEAGHVVVAQSLGLPVYGAQVVETDAGTTGCMRMLPPALAPVAPRAERTIESAGTFYLRVADIALPAASAADRALAVATMLVAGFAAEMRHAGVPWNGLVLGADTDTREARALVAPRALAWCQLKAHWLLRQQWVEVTAVAKELERRGEWFAQVAEAA